MAGKKEQKGMIKLSLVTFECSFCKHQWTEMRQDDKGEQSACPECGSKLMKRIDTNVGKDTGSGKTGFC
jgi:putative FmdB family regulatory protein